MEEEDGSTEVGLFTLEPGAGPAFNTAGTAAVKVVFCVNVDVREGRSDVAENSSCFKDHY
jgi:hypothetical protein